MSLQLFFLLILLLCSSINCFMHLSHSPLIHHGRYQLQSNPLQTASLKAYVRTSTKRNMKVEIDESTVLRDVINPTKLDLGAIFKTLAGQGLLLNLAFLGGTFFNIDVLHLDALSTEAEILSETLLPALAITIIVTTSGFLLRDFDLEALKQFFRERKFYVLRTLGIQSPIIQAAIVATLISFGEAFSDELFYRGFIFSSIHQQFGDNIAIGLSALVYGLVHYPIFGSNIVVESGLGLIYGASFLSAKFNLVVPVIIHSIYSLVSMYVTWYLATQDIRKRIISAETQAKKAAKDTNNIDLKFKAIAQGIFDIIDLDRSGKIDAKELKLGLRLFGFGPDVLDENKVKGTNYDVILKLLKNKDKEISSDKFVDILKEGLATWPRTDENLDYWKK